MIEAIDLHKSFGTTAAVRGVSLTARDGRITGLLGPNGAGKSTTLRMMTGLLRPDRGHVLVDGVDVARDPVGARRRLGVLPESPGIYPRLTARENLEYFARLHGLAGAPLDRAVTELVALLGIQTLAVRRAEGFSQGERTKVALGRALVHAPRTLLLDEPTNGLDVMSTRALRKTLCRLRDDGVCLLLSSHIMQEMAMLCDHLIVMAGGRVAAEGTPDEIRSMTGCDELESAFVQLAGVAEG